jgi:hypothetical protein
MKRLLPTVMILGLIAGCDDKQSSPPPGDDGAVEAADTADKPADDGKIAGKPVDPEGGNPAVQEGDGGNDQYTLSIEPQGDTAAGKPGVVKVKILPKGTWHMNHEYPTKLTVEAPAGVELAKAEQGKGDAVTFSDEACEFDVGFTAAQAGEKSFSGKFKFAICEGESACKPVSEDISFQVAVK